MISQGVKIWASDRDPGSQTKLSTSPFARLPSPLRDVTWRTLGPVCPGRPLAGGRAADGRGGRRAATDPHVRAGISRASARPIRNDQVADPCPYHFSHCPCRKLYPNWREGRVEVGCVSMIGFLILFLHVLVSPFKTQARLGAETVPLRHQLGVLRQRVPSRPKADAGG